MSTNICVSGSTLRIIALPPLVLFKTEDSVKSIVKPYFKIDHKHVLLQKDFDNWIRSYKSHYISATFSIPGELKGVKITLNNKSNQIIYKKDKLILERITTGIVQFQVTNPAKMPPPINTPDPIPVYTAKIVIDNSNQKIANCLR